MTSDFFYTPLHLLFELVGQDVRFTVHRVDLDYPETQFPSDETIKREALKKGLKKFHDKTFRNCSETSCVLDDKK